MKPQMRTLFFLLFFVYFTLQSFAQIDLGGQPISWSLSQISSEIPVARMPEIDLEKARVEDLAVDGFKETPYRFGIEHNVDLDFLAASSLDIYKGLEIRRLRIHCPDALSINLVFDEFYIPTGGELFIYNTAHADLKGAFTETSNMPSGVFPVGLIQGSDIIIDYTGPDSGLILHISQITHGYRPMLNKWEDRRGPFGNSGPCNINVNCPEGDAWQNQKRSVALIVQGGNALCSGALVNNTQQDGHPYFLTANHCLGNPSNWVYYFNHESATCAGNTGPSNNSISGGTLLANSANSDFALIELNQNPPESFHPFYAGWDKSDVANITNAIAIHHPSGDVKKISFEDDPPYKSLISATQVWWIDEWELGVTEGGSSGSPLFNQNGHIVGQLYGGNAACAGAVNNGEYDYFGRFGVSWNGASASVRLKDWLDPGNISPTALDGYGPYDILYALDAAQSGFVAIPEVVCSVEAITPSVKLKNNGLSELTSADLIYSYNSQAQETIHWTGNLQSSAVIEVPLALFTVQEGVNSIELEISNPNGGVDENPSNNGNLYTFNVIPGTSAIGLIEVRLITDQYAEETSWTVKDSEGNLIESSGSLNNSQLQTRLVSLPIDGCYEFTINDTYGDGICCEYGSGSYELRDFYGTVLASGAEFEFSQSHIINITDSYLGQPAPTIPPLEIGVYPSVPVDGETVRLSTNIDYDQMELEVFDAMGRWVHSDIMSGVNGTPIYLPELTKGIYILEFKGNDFKKVARLFLK